MLETVLFGPYQTHFHFEGASITSELGVEQVEPDGSIWRYDCVSCEGGPILLHRLVNNAVTKIERDEYRLMLDFESGAQLHILSDDSAYEAGQIYLGERLIVF